MDLQKEREAFEKAFAQTEFYRNKADLYSLLADIDDESFDFFRKNGFGEYSIGEAQAAWKAWQAAKDQAVPEGFVLVKKELPEQIAEKMAIDHIDKPRHENDPVWREIAEQSYKDQVKSKKWEFWRDYKAMIEAQEQSHE